MKNPLRKISVRDRFDPAMEEAYLDFKFSDSRGIVISVLVATVFLAVGLWVWDWALDPPHAVEALPTRILMGAILTVYPVALVSGVRRTFLPWLLAFIVLAVETVFLYHLTLLKEGVVYGLSGFMYWYMISLFTGLSFHLKPTMLTVIAIALLPNILAPLDLAPQLRLSLYNALIWPTCLITLFGVLVLDRFYRRLFLYQSEIEHTARIDVLTGIANRFHFSEAAPVLVELCRRHDHAISAFMVDIDHFKRINDEYGHPEGDEVIRRVADSMRAKLRNTDLLARYGGEEFVVILPETSPRAAAMVAEAIRKNVTETPLALGDGSYVHFTVSVGVAGYDHLPDEVGLMEILKQADLRLYEAKQSGRNRVIA